MNILFKSFTSVLGNCYTRKYKYTYIQSSKITFLSAMKPTCLEHINFSNNFFTSQTAFVAIIVAPSRMDPLPMKVAQWVNLPGVSNWPFNINIHSKRTVCIILAHFAQKHRLTQDTQYALIVRTRPEPSIRSKPWCLFVGVCSVSVVCSHAGVNLQHLKLDCWLPNSIAFGKR